MIIDQKDGFSLPGEPLLTQYLKNNLEGTLTLEPLEGYNCLYKRWLVRLNGKPHAEYTLYTQKDGHDDSERIYEELANDGIVLNWGIFDPAYHADMIGKTKYNTFVRKDSRLNIPFGGHDTPYQK